MVITGGENVFPRGIEDVLSRHDDVAEAVVVGVADDELGQRLVAYVAPRAGAHLDADELRAWLRPQVARYELPRTVTIIDALPRNATGKVVVRELPPPGEP
jgi:fatty-acyl-CoA synthase